jgi:arylformamidase
LSDVDFQAEYNNSGKVPDAPAIVAAWSVAAAAFRAGHAQSELDLAYGTTERTKLDIFWPDAGRDAPMAMFIHGGYWRMLDKSSSSHLARGLLAHGVAVAMPSYDLCPNVTLSVIVDEVLQAAAFLHRRYGKTMLATGHSAGGHLAAMLLAQSPSVTAALPISGLFDLAPLRATTVNEALQLDAAEAARLSPLLLPRPAGRLRAVVGGTEGAEYTRQSRSIAEAWGGSWESLAGHNHFTIVSELADPGSSIVQHALELLP